MKHKPINEQVVVITGASSGIGLCTALLAAERGAEVVLVSRSSDTLNEIVHAIAADGGRAHAMTADVSNRDDVDRVVKDVLAIHGRIDTVVDVDRLDGRAGSQIILLRGSDKLAMRS